MKRRGFVGIFLMVISGMLATHPARAGQVTLNAAEDAMGYEFLSGNNYAGSTTFPLLIVDANPTIPFPMQHNWRVWLGFDPVDLAGLGLTAGQVVSASLRMTVNTTDLGFGGSVPSVATPGQIDLYPITAAWTGAANGSWATQPAIGSLLTSEIFTAAPAGTVDFDITALVQSWLDTPADAFGVMLITPDTVNEFAFQFDSLEVGAQGPQLLIETLSVPEPAVGSMLALGLLALSRRKRLVRG